MRLLVIGGTRFVGRHISEAAIARGHEVTVFHRGKTGSDILPEATHVLGDRDHDLDKLSEGRWDATVDACGYVPRQISQLADALGDRAGRFAFISTVSVYAQPMPANNDEDAPLDTMDDPDTEVVDEQTYGPLKVLCEQVVHDRFGKDALIVRPTYVVGPHDYTHRFTYWVERIAQGGDVLAPEPRGYDIQVIDARDQADWTVQLLERGVSGTYHTVSPEPPFTFEQMLQTIVDTVGPESTQLVWVDAGFLTEHGVGGDDLPLWAEGDPNDPGISSDPSRAASTGLAPRPLPETIQQTLDHERTSSIRSGERKELSREREAELLAAWAER